MVTHEPDIARHAGRVIQFRDGRLISDQVIDDPIDARVMLTQLPTEQEAPALI